jgi:hypothetical protein
MNRYRFIFEGRGLPGFFKTLILKLHFYPNLSLLADKGILCDFLQAIEAKVLIKNASLKI